MFKVWHSFRPWKKIIESFRNEIPQLEIAFFFLPSCSCMFEGGGQLFVLRNGFLRAAQVSMSFQTKGVNNPYERKVCILQHFPFSWYIYFYILIKCEHSPLYLDFGTWDCRVLFIYPSCLNFVSIFYTIVIKL